MAKSNDKKPKALQLKWIEAGSLTANPDNWRKHSEAQLESLKGLIADEDIGWAGACLYNERTGRLIDGHARKSVADPKELVPVLVGSWSEEAERKILLTLDPVGAMAEGDKDLYKQLAEQVETDDLWVRDMIHNTAAGLANTEQDGDDDGSSDEPGNYDHLADMELQPFEHYDYIMLMFKDSQDFQQACERLEIKTVKVKYPGGRHKVGLGRVIDGAKAIARLLKQTGDK